MNTLTISQVQEQAPAAFSDSHKGTAKYGFIPTSRVIALLGRSGWVPTKVSQKRTKNPENRIYTKHLIEFQNPRFPAMKELGDSVPRILLTNSHDGTGSFRLLMGLIRLLCSNGLVAASGRFTDIRIRHVGFTDSKVLEAVSALEAATEKLIYSVQAFQGRTLNPIELNEFAIKAAALRFENSSPINPAQLLSARRTEDLGGDLWTVLNRVQENLVKGGIGYIRIGANGRNRNQSTRQVKAIDPLIKVNQGLWALAESYVNQAAA